MMMMKRRSGQTKINTMHPLYAMPIRVLIVAITYLEL